jgi:hypothetical protein
MRVTHPCSCENRRWCACRRGTIVGRRGGVLFVLEGKERAVGIRFLCFFFLFLGFFIFWIHPSVSLEDGLEVRAPAMSSESRECPRGRVRQVSEGRLINVFSVNYRVIVGSHVGSDVDLTLLRTVVSTKVFPSDEGSIRSL